MGHGLVDEACGVVICGVATVAHADVNDVFVTPRSVGLLWLNPPYGDAVADRGATGDDKSGGRQRLEKIFYRKTVSWLQFGGILVLIVPHYVLDAEFSAMIARHFERVQVFMAPEQRFKQCVVMGIKRRADVADSAVQKRLEAVGVGELPQEFPESWLQEPYMVPTLKDTFAFTAVRIDGPQLAEELLRFGNATLWPQFAKRFGATEETHRRPLRDLSDWHLALALAAGQISGVVTSRSGRTLLIKGDTFKERNLVVTHEERSDGSLSEVRTFTDKFVPVITGLDFTTGPTFGSVVIVK